MALAEAFGGAIFGVPVYDWLMVSSIAAKMTSFEYRYWPLSKSRIASVAFLSASVFSSFAIVDLFEPDGGLWPLVPVFAALVVHGGVAIADIFRQRDLYVPPEPSDRYGE